MKIPSFLKNCQEAILVQKTFLKVLSIKNVFLKIKNSIFSPKYTRYGKNVKKQIFLSQDDIQIYFGSFFDRTCGFRCNCKKRYKKRKISFCTKYMRGLKKILRNKIVCFIKIYKFPFDHFFITVIYFLLFIKNVFIKTKYSIFQIFLWKKDASDSAGIRAQVIRLPVDCSNH